MIENSQKRSLLFLLLLLILNFRVAISQGILIDRQTNIAKIDTSYQKIDPARFHKIQVFDLKLGRMVSDDRGFQRLLKNNGFAPGQPSFYEAGINYNYLIKKLNLGLKASIEWQSFNKQASLWHAGWQASIGYALKRKLNTILTLNSNLGVQTSTISFGADPPDFLKRLNYSHESSKLFQKQFILGPSINYHKIFNQKKVDRGLSLGFEVGINFAPLNPVWKYGYDDENYDFIGERIFDMPQAAKNSYFTSLIIGFWSAQ
ncbi:MAG: hypothetical protein V4683_19645 [Bacteroidota bacterium]